MAAELAEHGRRGEGDERYSAVGVEAVDRVDEPEACHLDQVLGRLAAAAIAQRHAASEWQVAPHELLADGRLAEAVVTTQKLRVVGERLAWAGMLCLLSHRARPPLYPSSGKGSLPPRQGTCCHPRGVCHLDSTTRLRLRPCGSVSGLTGSRIPAGARRGARLRAGPLAGARGPSVGVCPHAGSSSVTVAASMPPLATRQMPRPPAGAHPPRGPARPTHSARG